MATPSFNYETEAASIARRRKLLEALAADAMAPIQPQQLGNMAAEVTPQAGLAKVLQAFLASRGDKKLDARESALTKRYGEDLAAGMRGYYQTSEGYTETPTGRQVAGDPRKAIVNLMSSTHPGLREFGSMMQKEDAAQRLEEAKSRAQMALEGFKHNLGNYPTTQDVMGNATPASILQNFYGQGPLQPKVDLKAAPPGQVMYDESGTVRYPSTPEGKPAYNLVENSGALFQQTPTGLDPLNKSGVTVNTGNNPLLTSIAPKIFDAGMEVLRGKENAQRTLMLSNKLEQLFNSGAFSGPLAGAATFMTSLAEGMGFPLDDETKAKMVNSEVVQSQLAGRMSEFLLDSSVGRTLTDADRKRMEEQFPQLVNSAEGRKYIIQAMRAGADEKFSYAAQYMNDLANNPAPEAQQIYGWLKLAPQNVNQESLQQRLTPSTGGSSIGDIPILSLQDLMRMRQQPQQQTGGQ